MKIDIWLNSNSINEAIKKLNKFKKNLSQIENEFCYESCKWLQEKANMNLDNSTLGFNTSDIRNSWNIEKVSIGSFTNYRLYNVDNISVYAEFGTGLVGGTNPHPSSMNANYEYDTNGHGEKGWTFYNEEQGLMLTGFCGYVGKLFLYNAMWDYFYKNYYKSVFNSIVSKYIE